MTWACKCGYRNYANQTDCWSCGDPQPPPPPPTKPKVMDWPDEKKAREHPLIQVMQEVRKRHAAGRCGLCDRDTVNRGYCDKCSIAHAKAEQSWAAAFDKHSS